MLVFNQKTGALEAVLLDEGHLTDVRTAIAGAIAAQYLAPTKIECIGIVGTGMQARLQLEYLAPVHKLSRGACVGTRRRQTRCIPGGHDGAGIQGFDNY